MAVSGLNIIQIDLYHSKSGSAVLQKSIAVMYRGISLIQDRKSHRGLHPRSCVLD